MNKNHVLWFLAGWLLSLLFSPRSLLGLFQSVTSGRNG